MGISFAEAAEGKVRPGQEPLSLFDPARVREWWTKKVSRFLRPVTAGMAADGAATGTARVQGR